MSGSAWDSSKQNTSGQQSGPGRSPDHGSSRNSGVLHLGVLGYPLGHSASPALFAELFSDAGLQDSTYEKFEFAHLDAFFKWLAENPHIQGFNVTIPHKVAIMEHLDVVDPVAREVGAVNTVVVRRAITRADGLDRSDSESHRSRSTLYPHLHLHGYNTDVMGFEKALQEFSGWPEAVARISTEPLRALILGSGGSARAVAWVLNKLGLEIMVLSRDPDKARAGWGSFLPSAIMAGYEAPSTRKFDAHLLVNCTPAGMYPQIDQMPPLEPQVLRKARWVMDLIYNPERTRLISAAENLGITILNGSRMLHEQALSSLDEFIGSRSAYLP